ncbi:flagellar biosynthesis repressor FlbT [uncultured Bartonella sp.]|uniref:flagellar biosynthesis repressor FlbT n=1 Tax=uncultured Bartonella sp. TaxID=104108 RepID=UPI0025D97F65|nr:flagellar biosynthesis repressor FlbT [uncultured Bartonella sp.]
MTDKTMHITLRPNEKFYLNGAVLRPDRKVTLELLNDATFLLEAHVMQAEDTNTPLKQLYFTAQVMLIDPDTADKTVMIFIEMLGKMLRTYNDPIILEGLRKCIDLTEQDKIFDVLKVIRGLFDREETIMGKKPVVEKEQKTA